MICRTDLNDYYHCSQTLSVNQTYEWLLGDIVLSAGHCLQCFYPGTGGAGFGYAP